MDLGIRTWWRPSTQRSADGHTQDLDHPVHLTQGCSGNTQLSITVPRIVR